MMRLSLPECGIVAVAVATSVVLALLSYAGFASRGPSNSTSGYLAGWLALWLFGSVVIAVCAALAIVGIRREAAKSEAQRAANRAKLGGPTP